MKRKIYFSLLGGFIIFAWQFLSFAMPNFHRSESTYTPLQDTILEQLSKMGLKEGMYMLGQADPNASRDEQRKQYDAFTDKPWGVINYHEHMSMNMVMPMIRGFLVCVVISFLLFWLFLQQKNPTYVNRILLALAVGMIGFFFHPYTHFIWYQGPGIFAYFADAIFPWIILGILGHKMAKPVE